MSVAPARITPEPIHFVGRASSVVRAFLQSILLWPVVNWFCYPFLRRGAHRIPRKPVVFIANHGSHADTAVVLRALPASIRRRTVVAAAEDHFWRSPALGGFVSLLTGAFPFPRSGCEGLHRAERMLARGYNVLLYPEGTRSHEGRVGEFHQGAAILASRGATIVPVGLHGSAEVLPKGSKRPSRRPVAVVFGQPIESPEVDPATLRREVQALVHVAGSEVSDAPPTFFERARRFALSPWATRFLFLWALAEALLWPVVPDFALLPLILVAPGRALVFTIVTLTGSMAGGCVAYVLGASEWGPPLLAQAPLVTEPMVTAARDALAHHGAGGLLSQPLSGIPYKAFALQAAPAGLELPGYLFMSVLARGARFVAVALAAAALARALRPLWERALHLFLVLYAVSFGIGLARVVASWSH